jgi:hypothetical protein
MRSSGREKLGRSRGRAVLNDTGGNKSRLKHIQSNVDGTFKTARKARKRGHSNETAKDLHCKPEQSRKRVEEGLPCLRGLLEAEEWTRSKILAATAVADAVSRIRSIRHVHGVRADGEHVLRVHFSSIFYARGGDDTHGSRKDQGITMNECAPR